MSNFKTKAERKNSPFFITSKRLGFSHWQGSDLDFALRLWSDQLVNNLISENGFTRIEIETRLSTEIKYLENYGFQYFPLTLLDSNEKVGCCGFHPTGKDNDSVILGYHLIPPAWGRGLAFEAAEKMLAYAKDLAISKVIAGHHPSNHPSGKILQKLGFERVRDQFYKPTGKMHPTYELNLNSSKNS